MHVTCLTHLILLYMITATVLGEEYRLLSSLLCSILHFCYPVPFTSKYSQHPIFKHRQPTFLPQCEQPSLTPIQNNR
jgi:hypothetical protein